ncbi:pentapeptide repeat-containing protein [Sorangium cellulosum]|uniref:WD40 domain-containing protein n=1 Tax=Sorangium cellulosum TaxID=56 RepID=UPI003D9A25A4
MHLGNVHHYHLGEREFSDFSRPGTFLDEVLRVCALREAGENRTPQIVKRSAAEPFDEYAEVLSYMPKGPALCFLVAALRRELTRADVTIFQGLLESYRSTYRTATGQLIGTALPTSPEVARDAARSGIYLFSLTEYQGLIDLQPYLRGLVHRIDNDPIYPENLYVPQRAVIAAGMPDPEAPPCTSALDELDALLATEAGRFVLVLGDFGTGKTFLLRRLARRLIARNAPPYPVLLEMRHLDKSQSFNALLASHLTTRGIDRLDLRGFRYMLEHGLIALLFDGFDELAHRVRYDKAAEHFDTLVDAAQGKAKVVVTSRRQHFYSDQQATQALAKRAEQISGYRVIGICPFDKAQIHRFFVGALGNDKAARQRVRLLDEVKDLLGLSHNPRMLSFIARLPPERLRHARDRDTNGEISAATLYDELLTWWFEQERERAEQPGAALGITVTQRRRAVTALARRMWSSQAASVHYSELPAEVAKVVGSLDAHETAHAVGSGTLLVRDGQGRFSFVHRSVLEWLVADEAAKQVREGDPAEAFDEGEVSDLMADFFWGRLGNTRAEAWARQALAGLDGKAKSNALRVLRRLGASVTRGVDLTGEDLRGKDLSGEDLRGARLNGANLTRTVLRGARLSGASLAGALLSRADLEGADLRDADLEGADLSFTRLMGADLRGARLDRARLRCAALVGAQLDEDWEKVVTLRDRLGAAPPQSIRPECISAAGTPPCRSIAFHPEGILIATTHVDGTIRLWDSDTGQPLRRLQGHSSSVTSVVFSPDGATLASGSDDKTVRLWDVMSGDELRELQCYSGSVTSVAFSPDGSTLASGSDDETVRLWDVASGNELRRLQGHSSAVWSVAFSQDGATLASGSDDKTVRLWDVASGNELRRLHGHSSVVWSVTFSPDGATLASGSDDKTVRLWDVASGDELRRLQGHSSVVWSVTFSPDGATLASGSDDETVRLWDVASGNELRRLQGHSSAVWSVAFSPDGATLASGSDDVTVRLWDVASGNESRRLQGHSRVVFSVSFSPDGTTLASSAPDHTLRLWDAALGNELRRLHGHSRGLSCTTFSPDGATLASGSHDDTVRLWDVASGNEIRRLQGHSSAVWSVAFSPDGTTLVSGSDDDTVRLWDVASGNEIRQLRGHFRGVLSVTFSPDGAALASGSGDKTVRLWGVAPVNELQLLEGHSSVVWSVAFSPDGTKLASGSDDKTVRLWDVASGNELRRLHGHSRGVKSVAFSPDGAMLASGSSDGTVRLWSVASASEIHRLLGHAGSVRSIAFSPDGATLAVSCSGSIILWDLASLMRIADLIAEPEGWAVLLPDGRYKRSGTLAGAFWYAIGLCRFEPGELDRWAPSVRRLPNEVPLRALLSAGLRPQEAARSA